MTVQDLQDQLRQYSPDMEVRISSNDKFYEDGIRNVTIGDDGKLYIMGYNDLPSEDWEYIEDSDTDVYTPDRNPLRDKYILDEFAGIYRLMGGFDLDNLSNQ